MYLILIEPLQIEIDQLHIVLPPSEECCHKLEYPKKWNSNKTNQIFENDKLLDKNVLNAVVSEILGANKPVQKAVVSNILFF